MYPSPRNIPAATNPQGHPAPTLQYEGGLWVGRFEAMASPCEILLELEPQEQALAAELVRQAAQEAWRIEYKFSRYRKDNPLYRINHSQGHPLEVDAETARLLDFAQQCYALSDGLFDITSGVLRRAWRFDGSDRLPSQRQIDALLPYIGWHRVRWQAPRLTLPTGMELDFGGIGKEYAVDRSLLLLQQTLDTSGRAAAPLLVNFGGDLACNGPRRNDQPWQVGIERADLPEQPCQQVEMRYGALATSGDARRYLLRNGKRYSHVLNPKTGWPVAHAPRSVTVAAATCTEAGLLATLALLQGRRAEVFLRQQQARYWLQR